MGSKLRRNALLLVPALACGLCGCCGAEMEAVEPLVEMIVVTGTVIGAAHDLQEMDATRLESEQRRQCQSGQMTTFQPQWIIEPAPVGYPPASPSR